MDVWMYFASILSHFLTSKPESCYRIRYHSSVALRNTLLKTVSHFEIVKLFRLEKAASLLIPRGKLVVRKRLLCVEIEIKRLHRFQNRVDLRTAQFLPTFRQLLVHAVCR